VSERVEVSTPSLTLGVRQVTRRIARRRVARHLRSAGRVVGRFVRQVQRRQVRFHIGKHSIEFFVGVLEHEVGNAIHFLTPGGLLRVENRGGGFRGFTPSDVAHLGHAKLEDDPRGLAAAPVAGGAQFATQREQGLGERLVGDFAGGDAEQAAVGEVGGADQGAEGVGLVAEFGGDRVPRLPAGAQGRDALEGRGLGGGCVGDHGETGARDERSRRGDAGGRYVSISSRQSKPDVSNGNCGICGVL
jgi:hypothetical protein